MAVLSRFGSVTCTAFESKIKIRRGILLRVTERNANMSKVREVEASHTPTEFVYAG